MSNKKNLYSNYYLIPIIIFPFLLFSVTLFTGRSLFWGTPALQFIPWRVISFSYLTEGIIPLWNPYNGMGAPLAANYQSAVFYPPSWLLYFLGIFGADWIAWGFTLLVIIHLIWSGVGMAQLLKILGFSEMSQMISGMALSLCGYFIARAGFFSMIFAGSWFPWMVVYASKIAYPGIAYVQKISKKSFLTFIIIAGMQLLAGHAQLTWYSWLFVSCWIIAGFWSNEKWRGLWKGIKNLAIVSGLAVALASVQLAITVEYLVLSQRSSAVAYDTAMTYSFWPWRLLGFIAPDLFGNPGAGNYWGYASYWEDAVYFGVLPFILAILTIPILWKKRNSNEGNRLQTSLVRFLWAFTLISILFSLGKNTALFPFLYRFVPTFDMFNAPTRYMVWATFCLVVLAGMGYENWRRPSGRGLYWFRLITAGGFAITIGAFLALYLLQDVNLTFIKATAITGLCALISGFLTLFNQKNDTGLKNKIWKWSIIIFIGFDLILAGWNINPTVKKSYYSSPIMEEGNLFNFNEGKRVYLHPDAEYFLKFKRFLQFSNFNLSEDWENMRFVLLPNLNLLDRVSSANNFDPLVTNRYQNWMDQISDLPKEKRHYWLRLMNVGAEEVRDRSSPNYVRYQPINDSQRFWWFTCGKNVSSEEEALNEVSILMNNPYEGATENYVIIEGDNETGFDCEAPLPISVEPLLDGPNKLLLRVNSSQSGWLMISDAFYPGWRVKVNDTKVKLFPANYMFRAIKLAPGESLVHMSYSPITFWVGLGFTCISVIFMIVLFFLPIKVLWLWKD